MQMGRDGIAGLILLGLSLALLAASINLPYLPLVPVGPAFYPRIVLVFLAATSIVMIGQDLARARRTPASAAANRDRQRLHPRVAAAFAVVGAYALLISFLGFRFATVLFVAALQAVLEWPRTPRQWLVLVAVAVATSAITFLVFEHYLLVLLPRGAWTGF